VIEITVHYHNILRARAGVASEMVTLSEGATLLDLLNGVAEARGAALREVVFAADGAVSSHLVAFRNKHLLPVHRRDAQLSDGDEVMLFPAIAGG